MSAWNGTSGMAEDTTPLARDPVPRRRVLSGACLLASAAVAGCTGPLGGGPEGTATQPARLWLEAVDAPDEAGSVDPIEYGSLSDGERSLVDTALEEDEYVVDTDETPPAWESLRERVEARTRDGGELVVYLVRDDRYYRVGFANGDNVVAHPDAPF